MSLYSYENEARNAGFSTIAGVDEAGRGPLAGPVVVAACVLPALFFLEGLNDSKQLSEKKREAFFQILTTTPEIHYAIKIIEPEEIDRLNILQATLLGMKEAVKELKVQPDFVLIDGNQVPKIELPCKAIVDGDRLSASIAAASILAKVTRDRLMVELDKKFPLWNFSKHKGYPTKEHIALLEKFGVSPIHRTTFGPVNRVLVANNQKSELFS
ncbi:MAG: ribonuclease HII [Chlamydiia bacterium]